LVSDNERHERVAFRELEVLIRHLGDELASFRRRALQAETQLRAVEARGSVIADVTRLEALEADNAELRGRLEVAAGRAQSMLDRVRFLRQQQEQAPGAAAAAAAAGER
jgi:hypothetical protein